LQEFFLCKICPEAYPENIEEIFGMLRQGAILEKRRQKRRFFFLIAFFGLARYNILGMPSVIFQTV